MNLIIGPDNYFSVTRVIMNVPGTVPNIDYPSTCFCDSVVHQVQITGLKGDRHLAKVE